MGVKLVLYQDIKARLEDKVPEIRTIRKWNNQFDNEARENAFAYPCCFIGYSDIVWNGTMGITPNTTGLHQEQKGNIVITLYVGFEKYEDESDSWDDIEPIINKIWHSLQGYTNSVYYNSLVRIAEREDNNHDNVIVWQIDFMAGVVDCAGLDTTIIDASPATLSLTGELIITPTTQSNLRTANDFNAEDV